MKKFSFTRMQLDVLEEIPRRQLTLVAAGPGSGKTQVFVEALRRELTGWTSSRNGIAALSFTNVAHKIISERLGGVPPPPHFVGTLDAFLLRFVVHPFAKLVGAHPNGVRLVPDPVARCLERPVVPHGSAAWEKASIFQFNFCGGDENMPQFSLRDKFGRPLQLSQEVARNALAAKRRDWRASGRITHSDSHFLASCILKSQVGKDVVELIRSRFPVLLVDEFQDTGWFLGRALSTLLVGADRAVVVGDPDQAIYQFVGVDRTLFASVERASGARALPLNESHRCPKKVCKVASSLSRSRKEVMARHDAIEGKAFLFVYSGAEIDAQAVVTALDDKLSKDEKTQLVVLSRKARKYGTPHSGPWPNGSSLRLARALGSLAKGDARQAAQLVSRELAHLLLDIDSPTPDTLREKGIDPRYWKGAIASILFEIAPHVPNETWNAWIVRVRRLAENVASTIGIPKTPISQNFRQVNKGGDVERVVTPEKNTALPFQEMTVHAAKGLEFPTVLMVVPKPHATNAPCPSTTWWSEDPSLEEREVAYVAVTRAEQALCIAVHADTYRALREKQPAFVSLFEIVTQPPASARSSATDGRRRRLTK